jgi:hypothetical protein
MYIYHAYTAARSTCDAKPYVQKGNKGNRPERQLAALGKQALRTSVVVPSGLHILGHQFIYKVL